MNRRLSRAVPTLLLVAAAGVASAADSSPIQIGDGQSYVVALDELQAGSIAPAALPVGITRLTPDGRATVDGAASLGDLDRIAGELRRGSGRPSVAAVLYPAGGSREGASRIVLGREITLHVRPGADAAAIARRHGCRVASTLAPNVALLEHTGPGLLGAVEAARAMAADPLVVAAEPQLHRRMETRFTPTDPLTDIPLGTEPLLTFPITIWTVERNQWHLHRAPRGMQVEPVWGSDSNLKDGYTGSGVLVAVVDTGVDARHPDLGVYPDGNLRTDIAWDFLTGTSNILPRDDRENHGTAVAGVIAEREGNNIGGVGVAFNAQVVPIRFISHRDMNSPDPLTSVGGTSAEVDPNQVDKWPGKTDAQFLQAVQYQLNPGGSDPVWISNNAWGNAGVANLIKLSDTAWTAFANGVQTGRRQRGIIFVWPVGNDHGLTIPYRTDCLPEDNACYDAWLNRYVVPVGALNRAGRRASYSEIGPSLLVCAPGGDFDFTPYEPWQPTDTTVMPGPNTPAPPTFWMHGLTTTDRSRQFVNHTLTDPGYNPGERDLDGDDGAFDLTQMNYPNPPDYPEDLIWIDPVTGTVVPYPVPDGHFDNVDEDINHNGILDAGEDLDGDNYLDTGEDHDHDRRFDLVMEPDLDRDGRCDCGEHFDGFDANGDGTLSWTEDLDGDGNFDITNEDTNGNGILDPGEDLDGDGHLDLGVEDLDGDGHADFVNEDVNKDGWPLTDPTTPNEERDFFFDVYEDCDRDGALDRTEDLDGDGRFDNPGEDLDRDRLWSAGNYIGWTGTGYTNPSYDVAGTSFAAANASGVIALMLQARPELTWRDVQLILAYRARKPARYPFEGAGAPPINTIGIPYVPAFLTSADYDWLRGLRFDVWTPSSIAPGAGFFYNHWYGFGAINATKAVYGSDLTFGGTANANNPAKIFPGYPTPLLAQVANPGALRWPLLPAEETPLTASFTPTAGVTDATNPASGIIRPASPLTGQPRLNLDLAIDSGVADFLTETVEVDIKLTGSNRSRFTFGLVSPRGTVAHIPQRLTHAGESADSSYGLDYRFTLRNFLGENPTGSWRFIAVNTLYGEANPIINSLKITVNGHRTYPVPTASGATPSGLPASGQQSRITLSGSNYRQNASGEVTMTKAYWYDNDADTSAQVYGPGSNADDLSTPTKIVELDAAYIDNGRVSVTIPPSLTDPTRSPGDAAIIVGNPALPVAQFIPPTRAPQVQTQPPQTDLNPWKAEDRYSDDVWEVYTAVNITAPIAIQRRIKRSAVGTELTFRYSRPPVITPIGDILLPAGTAVGSSFSVNFTIDDPDISAPNVGRSTTDESLTVGQSVFNQSVVPASSVALTPTAVGPQNNGAYQLTGTIAGTSGLSLIQVTATDGVSTTTTSFRVGVLTDETASGCGGGMGLALLGGPLAVWLIGRRRRR